MLKRMATYLGLVEGSTARADDELDVSGHEEPVFPVRAAESVAAAPAAAAPVAKVGIPTPVQTELSRIVTLNPTSYNQARRIGEEFRNGVPVIMNVTDMDDSDAKRLVDFAAGLVFGLHGTIERVTNKVFLLSPANVDVGAIARAQARGDGFFNQS
ncbi:MAG: cell division protein SepF [Actinomycetales bacterium]|nr:cell division protein SepF [Actinomycetales bacterium]